MIRTFSRTLAIVGSLLMAGAAWGQGAPGGQSPMMPVSGFTASTPYTATGGSTATSDAGRATYKGAKLDFRADFGAACDGSTDDTSALTSMIASVGATSTPILVTFPGTCVINAGNYVISGALSFGGINNGGVKLAAAQNLTADLFHWSTSSKNIYVNNMLVDLNGATSTGTVDIFGYFGTPYFSVTGSQIINAAAATITGRVLLIAAYGVSGCDIIDNIFSLQAASIYQSEAINFGTPLATVNHCIISRNTSKNTGFGFFFVDDLTVTDNEIYGWGFGGGITLGPYDTNAHQIIVSHNNIHDSSAVPDINVTYDNGIESWIKGATIVGNTTSNTCGPGIGINAAANYTGNRILNAGSCAGGTYYQSGLAYSNDGSGHSGDNAWIDGNVVSTDNGNTLYGYSDVQAAVNVQFGVNSLIGTLGSYNTNGQTSFTAAQDDNRIVNPCFEYDQRNEAAGAVLSGFAADQWTLSNSQGHVSYIRTTTALNPCRTSLQIRVTSSGAPAASDYNSVYQNIALNDVYDFNFATTAPKSFVYSFCASMSTPPPYTGTWFVLNMNSSYSYLGAFTITAAANTPQCFAFSIPGDSHSLGVTLTATALRAGIDTGMGSNNHASPAGSWISGQKYGLATSTPFVSLPNNTTMQLSDVRLYPAPADQGWLQRSPSQELANVQRFYRKTFAQGVKPAQNVASYVGALCAFNPIALGEPSAYVAFQPPMLLSPTITTFNPSAANANWYDVTASASVTATVPSNATSVNGSLIGTSATVTTLADELCIHYTADGGL